MCLSSLLHGQPMRAFSGDASVASDSGHKIKECVVEPDWPAPKKVRSIITLAQPLCGSSSVSPISGRPIHGYGHFNLALHVEDDQRKVMHNRQSLAAFTGIQNWQWLSQVHGAEVIQAAPSSQAPQADGCFTREPKLACAILTADCLPLLICNEQGTQVAAVHAGWRGLAAGVVEQAVKQFDQQDRLLAYLGPAIGPLAFEIGPEVKQAFSHYPHIEAAFKRSVRLNHYFADLYVLAKQILNHLGVSSVYGGTECTYTSEHHFYSYRREAKTGRMASAIWFE